MDPMSFTDVLCISLAAVAGFKVALAADYLLLRFLLQVMRSSVPRKCPDSRL